MLNNSKSFSLGGTFTFTCFRRKLAPAPLQSATQPHQYLERDTTNQLCPLNIDPTTTIDARAPLGTIDGIVM